MFGDTVICKLKGRLQAVAKIRCALESPAVNSFDAGDAHMHFFVSHCGQLLTCGNQLGCFQLRCHVSYRIVLLKSYGHGEVMCHLVADVPVWYFHLLLYRYFFGCIP